MYDFAGLNPANYNLTVTAKGFKTYTQNGIVVNVSGTFRVDVKLTIGAETTTVTVQADALTVQTDSNVVSTLITSEDITSLATENRNIVNLAALGMGVSSELPDNNSLGAFGANFSIEFNGLREAHNIWLIDGGESADRGGGGGTQIQPSQDAIAEFQMMTSNYPPDYGISSGATISMSLKSGTKDFHGSAWEFNRATAYNANSFFNKYNGATQCPAGNALQHLRLQCRRPDLHSARLQHQQEQGLLLLQPGVAQDVRRGDQQQPHDRPIGYSQLRQH